MTKPILFRGAMVRALLNTACGNPPSAIEPHRPWKWQTRRPLIPQPQATGFVRADLQPDGSFMDLANMKHRPRYNVGDVLWVKETWCRIDDVQIAFRADEWMECPADDGKWKPSIFMPRMHARLWMLVERIRCERVNQISEADANAEGIPSSLVFDTLTPARRDFANLWDSIHGAGAFGRGEWVWVYELSRVEKQ